MHDSGGERLWCMGRREKKEGKLGDMVVYPGAAGRHAENEWRWQ